jgi:hypothetical protein
MTTPLPLSPDAQAVLDAVADGAAWPFHVIASPMAAAAIRAAVDRVVPESEPPQRNDFTDISVFQWAVDCHHQDEATRAKFLAIATELEGNTTTTTQEKT